MLFENAYSNFNEINYNLYNLLVKQKKRKKCSNIQSLYWND